MRFWIIIIWILTCSLHFNKNVIRPVFGVKISYQANNSMTTFVCYIDNGRTLAHQRILTQEEFIKIVSGFWPSIYNPNKIDFFKERNLNCGVYKDSITLKTFTYGASFDSLWKVRFSTYPFRGGNEEGWAIGKRIETDDLTINRPSLKQEKYLYDTYKVRRIDGDFFIDTNFWKLMNDVLDPIWIKNYKSLRD